MRPWFGLHLPNYTFPDTPPERLFDRVVEQARAAEDAGFSLVTVMDHLYQIDGVGSGHGPDARRLVDPRGARARDEAGPARDAGHRRHLSEPRPPRQDGHDARRHLRWPRHPRARGGLERGRARRLRLRLPAGPGADGPPRRGAHDHPGDVHGGPADLRRPALPGPRGPQRPAADPAGRPARSWSAAVASSGPSGSPQSTPT